MKLEARSVGSGTSAQNLFVTHDTDGQEIAPVQITAPGLHPRWAKAIVDAVNAAHARAQTFASVGWTVGDVQTLAGDLTDEQAEEFLCRNDKHLQDRQVEHGWEVLENLLTMDGIKITKVED
jgi:hypothetical protein